MDNSIKNILDWSSFGTAFGTVMKWMPEVAALFSIVWMAIRLYEWAQEKRKK